MDTAPYEVTKLMMSSIYGKHADRLDFYLQQKEMIRNSTQDCIEKRKTLSPPDDDDLTEMDQVD